MESHIYYFQKIAGIRKSVPEHCVNRPGLVRPDICAAPAVYPLVMAHPDSCTPPGPRPVPRPVPLCGRPCVPTQLSTVRWSPALCWAPNLCSAARKCHANTTAIRWLVLAIRWLVLAIRWLVRQLFEPLSCLNRRAVRKVKLLSDRRVFLHNTSILGLIHEWGIRKEFVQYSTDKDQMQMNEAGTKLIEKKQEGWNNSPLYKTKRSIK